MISKQLQDEEFKKEYDAIQPEMDVIRAIVDARTSQNMTQKELAEHDSKEIIFNITPHKFEKNSHLHLLIFTSKFSNIKEVRQD